MFYFTCNHGLSSADFVRLRSVYIIIIIIIIQSAPLHFLVSPLLFYLFH